MLLLAVEKAVPTEARCYLLFQEWLGLEASLDEKSEVIETHLCQTEE